MRWREIAEKLGVGAGRLNYPRTAAFEKDWMEVRNFIETENKLGSIFVLMPQGIAEKAVLAGRFLRRKMSEYGELQSEIETLEVKMACLNISGPKGRKACCKSP
jgi:hypothetical protein